MALWFGRPLDQNDDTLSEEERNKFNSLLLSEVQTVADNRCNLSFIAFRGFAAGFMETHYKPWQMGFNFDAAIPYEAMNIVDQINLNDKIPSVHPRYNTILFLTTALLLPWKKKNTEINISEFLNQGELNYLTERSVRDMEIAILRWPITSVTPFSFIEFLKPLVSLPRQSSSQLRPVYKLIVKSKSDIAFTEFRPSIIAASAMQVFISNVFPHKEYDYEQSVIKLLRPVQGMIPKCTMMLKPLYQGPVTTRPRSAPEQASGSLLQNLAGLSSMFSGRSLQLEMEALEELGTNEEEEEAATDDLMNFNLGWINALANIR